MYEKSAPGCTCNGKIIFRVSFQNGTLPNPIDIVLVWAQNVFPLDYILYSSIILFLVFCSVSGVKDLGIRCSFLCLPLPWSQSYES
jgi:hypothetical protein